MIARFPRTSARFRKARNYKWNRTHFFPSFQYESLDFQIISNQHVISMRFREKQQCGSSPLHEEVGVLCGTHATVIKEWSQKESHNNRWHCHTYSLLICFQLLVVDLRNREEYYNTKDDFKTFTQTTYKTTLQYAKRLVTKTFPDRHVCKEQELKKP